MKTRVTSFAAISWAAFSMCVSACGSDEGENGPSGGAGGSSSSSGGPPVGSGGSAAPSGGAVSANGGSTQVPASGGGSVGGSGTSVAGGSSGGAAAGGAPSAAAGGAGASAGSVGSAGSAGRGGAGGGGGGGTAGKGGASAGTGGGSSGSAGAAGGAPTGGSGGGGASGVAKFSFFVTSLAAMRELSKSENGFGGDLRFGEPTGLAGADKICTTIAEKSMAGAGQKQWRAFLSTSTVHAADRIGMGPWYDRLGRLIAMTKADLLQTRPRGADVTIINDLPNESGVPNHTDGAPGCSGNSCPDNHDTLTGSDTMGMRDSGGALCADWTSTTAAGRPRVGHSWPANSGQHWIQAHVAGGCGAGVNLVQGGGMAGATVGAMGGYGGIYCLASTP